MIRGIDRIGELLSLLSAKAGALGGVNDRNRRDMATEMGCLFRDTQREEHVGIGSAYVDVGVGEIQRATLRSMSGMCGVSEESVEHY
jgi:hypothetical protein